MGFDYKPERNDTNFVQIPEHGHKIGNEIDWRERVRSDSACSDFGGVAGSKAQNVSFDCEPGVAGMTEQHTAAEAAGPHPTSRTATAIIVAIWIAAIGLTVWLAWGYLSEGTQGVGGHLISPSPDGCEPQTVGNPRLIRVIDIETTGIDPATDAIIEIANVDMVRDGGITNAMDTLVRPGKLIPPGASAIHHIIDEDLKDVLHFPR